MFSLTTGLLLGLVLGMRHALEPDHLAAVSVLITRRGKARGGSGSSGAILGAVWGLGHTLALFVVGCVLAVIGARLPARLAEGFELLVAAMLIALGTRAIYRAACPPSAHQGDRHTKWSLVRQPLVVGLVHGLAGSGALTTLAIASLPTLATRLLYIGLFGLGSVIGMAGLTGLAGWPLARLEAQGVFARWLLGATGAFSLLLGVTWGWSALHGVLR